MRAALAALVAVALTACGGSGDGDQGRAMDDDMHMHDDGGHRAPSEVAEGARRVTVVARSFEFEPDEVRAEAGEDLAIALRSEDVVHDLTIDELDAHVSATKDDPGTGGVRAERPGRYVFYCSVPGHRSAGMEGTLVVE